MKRKATLESCKEIASRCFIDMMGEKWIKENSSNICSIVQDKKDCAEITFALASSLPTETEILENDSFVLKDSITFSVNKETLSCNVLRYNMPFII